MMLRTFRIAVPAALLLLAVVAGPAVAQTYPPPLTPEEGSIELSSPESICAVVDIPYLTFSATFTGSTLLSFVDTSGLERADAADLGAFSGQYASDDGDGSAVSGVIRAQFDIEVAGGEVVDVLWPGMELDADGNPVSWPGWAPIFDDGTIVGWDEVDDGFAWARTQDATELGVFATTPDGDTTDLYPVTYVAPEEICSDPPDVEVGGEVEERPEGADTDTDDTEGTDPGTDPGPDTTAEDPIGAAPPQVLGVSLVRTGADALLVALAGLGLLGLGFVALRRTRESHN